MPMLVISTSLLALLLTLAANANTLRQESVKRSQLTWIKGEKRYLDAELEHSFWQRNIQPILSRMTAATARLSQGRQHTTRQRNQNQRLAADLSQAGIRMQVQEYQFLQLLVIVGIIAAGILSALIWVPDAMLQFLVVLFALVLAILAPRYFLKSRIKSRQLSIQNQMPNVMDVLSVSIEAGLGFDAALQKVIERFRGPLIDELTQVYREVQMGMARHESLQRFSQRSNVAELKTFVSAVIQSEQFGTPLKNVLKVQSQQLRVSRRQQAQEKGMKAPVRMMLPMVFFIFPVIFIVLLGPTLINVVRQFM